MISAVGVAKKQISWIEFFPVVSRRKLRCATCTAPRFRVDKEARDVRLQVLAHELGRGQPQLAEGAETGRGRSTANDPQAEGRHGTGMRGDVIMLCVLRAPSESSTLLCAVS